ncbi:MAG: alpha/beta hydrolase [Cyanobacteria bacterium J06642_2]
MPQTLYCHQWGERRTSTLPVLMLHGHPGNGHAMAVFAEALQNEYWALAPDLRGYGRSRATAAFTMTDHLSDLATLLDRFELERCLVLGWSLGGILAVELALRYPERVCGTVLIATAARPRSNHPPTTLWDDMTTGLAATINWFVPGWQWNIDTLGKRSLFRYLVQQHTPTTYAYFAHTAVPAYLKTSRYARQALSTALKQRYNRLPDLPKLHCPALVMAAEHDRHITCASSRETARAIPNSTWIGYDDVAHLFPWEIPQRVRTDLKTWMQQHGF